MTNILVDQYAKSKFFEVAKARVDDFFSQQGRQVPTQTMPQVDQSRAHAAICIYICIRWHFTQIISYRVLTNVYWLWSYFLWKLCQKPNGMDQNEARPPKTSFLIQTSALTRRSFINMRRDIGYYWLRLAIYIVLTTCIGSIYFNIGTAYQSIMVRKIQSQELQFKT